MNEIFISHSKRDEQSIKFFNRLFSSTKVKAIYEEIDGLQGLEVNSNKIKIDIQNSSALFLLHDNLIESMSHTRDWITWECGIANSLNKEIWMFEKSTQTRINKMVIPHVDNLIVYEPNNEDWIRYLLPIINKFEEFSTIATPVIGAAIVALISEDKVMGGLLGLSIGALLNKQNPVPNGEWFMCSKKCKSNFKIHIPPNQLFRCPICNELYQTNK